MPNLPPVVNVFAMLTCEEDATFAGAVKQALATVAPIVKIQDLDRLAATASARRLAHLAALKIPVFVLSRECLADPQRRAFIASGDPLLGRPSQARRYYICRNSRPAALLAMFPELHSIANETMLVSSDSVDQVVADLCQYLTSEYITRHHKGLRLALFTISLPFRLSISLAKVAVLTLADILGRFLFFAGFLAGPLLAVLLLLDISQGWLTVLAATCLFTCGKAIHNVDTMDFWPWLGPRWRAAGPSDRDSNGAETMDRSECSDSQLEEALSEWRSHQGWLLVFRSLVFGTTLVPAVVAVVLTGGTHFVVLLTALVAGSGLPLVLAVSRANGGVILAAHRGLTESFLGRTERRVRRFVVAPIPVLSGVADEALKVFNDEELTTIRRWVSLVSFSGVCAFDRPWRRRPDRVFVSYVWADDPQLGVAGRISRALDSCGMAHYIDKRPIDSGFVGWRTNVAVELNRATHVLLVVSPSIVKGVIVGREMRAILARWFTDALPSVVCVADHEVVEALRCDPEVPLHLRFFLTWCPCLTPAEASNAELLSGLVAQRCRQGRLRDWGSLLLPERSYRRARAGLVSPTTARSITR